MSEKRIVVRVIESKRLAAVESLCRAVEKLSDALSVAPKITINRYTFLGGESGSTALSLETHSQDDLYEEKEYPFEDDEETSAGVAEEDGQGPIVITEDELLAGIRLDEMRQKVEKTCVRVHLMDGEREASSLARESHNQLYLYPQGDNCLAVYNGDKLEIECPLMVAKLLMFAWRAAE